MLRLVKSLCDDYRCVSNGEQYLAMTEASLRQLVSRLRKERGQRAK
ncbi:hypothetical protein [Lichenibacterium ramalinae]|nr:hypothetical protein [Lichenibacterium ramalinae]